MPFPARRAGTQRRFQCFSRKFGASALDTAQKYVMIMDTDFTKGSVPHASLSRPHFELYPQGGHSLLRGAGRAGLHSFVPPSAAYISYFDFRVLCLLFCLMAVVAGLRGCGLFEALALRLLRGKKTLRFLALMLVLLPFSVPCSSPMMWPCSPSSPLPS